MIPCSQNLSHLPVFGPKVIFGLENIFKFIEDDLALSSRNTSTRLYHSQCSILQYYVHTGRIDLLYIWITNYIYPTT